MRRDAKMSLEENRTLRFDAVLHSSLSDLLQVAAMIKNDGFIEEREVRFISPMIERDDEMIAYRVGRSALIPYVEFGLADDKKELAIHEIMVGPSPTQHLTESSLRGFVRSAGIKESCIVSRSNIPYREL